RYTYDQRGLVTSRTDPGGHRTDYGYDEVGRPAPAAPPAAPAPSPFAPPSPFPAPAPAAFGAPAGGPGAPANPWAPPGAGYGAAAYAPYGQAAPAGNGLAVAALVVGICAIAIGLVPLLFWIGALLAVTGLGLGIGALVRASNGAPRKTMSVVGTVLGVLGLGASVGGFFLTAAVMDEAADSIDRSIERQRDRDLEGAFPEDGEGPGASPSPSASQAPGLTSALPFGETFTYGDGIKVSLSAPKKYKPESLYGRETVKNAVQMTVTITNGSTRPHEVIYAVPNVRDDKGMTAELVFDGSVPKMIQGSILPGASASGVMAFEVPEGTVSITADIAAGTLLDDVKYAGPIG
ncbi:hypothetical protein ACFWUW_28595, partial [Streptomyces sp. NPDC058655]|uniref:hypothetical protein n=1 Tax=Streptomyces sp. NPDC058655 TaxID=3346577 RepID=UPI00365D9B1E